MSSKKPADLTAALVATKGQASPSTSVSEHQLEVLAAKGKASAPLNFKVEPEFRRRFRQRAAAADLKLNTLLHEALEAWEQKHGLV